MVVAAVIQQDGKFLVGRRLFGTHLSGYWEFPGGKVHEGESYEGALEREIAEELGTGISDLDKIFQTVHSYSERTVELHFYRGKLTGTPHLAGSELRWIARGEFTTIGFLREQS